jgi:hypothetical protein
MLYRIARSGHEFGLRLPIATHRGNMNAATDGIRWLPVIAAER